MSSIQVAVPTLISTDNINKREDFFH